LKGPARPSDSPRVAARAEERVREAARKLGFDAVAFARADVALDDDFARYESFLAKGMHGEMKWLADNRDVRARVDTDAILEGARTVICLARRYDRSAADEANDPPLAKRIARYARGQDYHNTLRKKLRKLAAFVRTLGADGETVHARPLCDDAPILERAWAARAGLGFVGKNGLLIVPGQGSFVLLGEVVTTLRLEPDQTVPDRCGACTLCLDACPTDAFVEPRVLDARRCISYLTIELRGPIPEALRTPIGDRLFGCDDCQSVCPWNAKGAAKEERAERNHRAGMRVFSPHPRWAEATTRDLVRADEEAFAVLGRGSPVHRATRDGIVRNASIVCGNEKDESARGALEAAAASDASDTVREAARWALSQLE
jgi:epoxyqueuosine reductase